MCYYCSVLHKQFHNANLTQAMLHTDKTLATMDGMKNCIPFVEAITSVKEINKNRSAAPIHLLV